MPSPSSALATLRPDLAGSFMEFDTVADREGYVGTRALIPIDVAKPTGTFGRIPLEQLVKPRDTARAPGAGYSRGEFTFKPETFACIEYGAEEPVDDRENNIYSNFFQAEQIAAERARTAVLRGMEKRIAALLFNTTTWTGASLTTAVGIPWSTYATAVPHTDVLAARKKVFDGTGLWPNAIILSKKKFLDIRECTSIVDRLKYSGIDDPKSRNITPQVIAQVLDLDFVLVAGGGKDTATEGQTRTVASIWTDTNAMVARVAVTADISEPCVGRIFHYAEDGSTIGGTVESYREESKRSTIIRVRNDIRLSSCTTERMSGTVRSARAVPGPGRIYVSSSVRAHGRRRSISASARPAASPLSSSRCRRRIFRA